jgi:hypothetical protein
MKANVGVLLMELVIIYVGSTVELGRNYFRNLISFLKVLCLSQEVK